MLCYAFHEPLSSLRFLAFCFFTFSTLHIFRNTLSSLLVSVFSLTLTHAASGMYEHRYYEATLNNRSLALCDRRTRLWGNIHVHKYMDTNIQSK